MRMNLVSSSWHAKKIALPYPVILGRGRTPLLAKTSVLSHPRCCWSTYTPRREERRIVQQQVKTRYFSSSLDTTGENSTKPQEAKKYRVLYERNAVRNLIPRAALGVSLFNTSYWTWYCWDFIPAVNASPIESLHVSPTIGLFGLALGAMINSVTVLYPMVTVSKVAYSPTHRTFRVWKHDIPLIRPSSTYSEHKLGDFSMDPSSGDAKKIVNHLDGDMSRFRGHLGVSVADKKLPFLLEIRDGTEVKASTLMFQALIDPRDLERGETMTKSQTNNQQSKGKKKARRRRR